MADADATNGGKEFQRSLPKLQQQFIDAYNRRDVAAIVDFYLPDAYIVRPDKNVVRGQEAIGDYHLARMTAGQRLMRFHTLAVATQESTAIEITDSTVELPIEGAGSERRTTRVIAIWRRQADEGWKLEADVFT